MKISEYIKEYRKINNISQTEFAQKLFVSKQTVSKWENDKGLPDISLYPELAKILNVSIDELMGKELENNNEEKQVVKMTKKNNKKYLFIIPIVIVACLGLCWMLFVVGIFIFTVVEFFQIFSFVKGFINFII